MENEIQDVGDIVPSDGKSLIDSLEWSFFELCKQLGVEINRLRLRSALEDNKELIDDLGNGTVDWRNVVRVIALSAGIDGLQFMDQADPGRLPALSWIPRYGWVIIRSINAAGEWVIQANSANTVALLIESSALPCVRLSSVSTDEKISKDKPVFKLFYKEFFIHKPILIEIVLASVLINLMALGTSLYSMQVYDRVIPTQGYSTLAVLTFGVALTMIFDFLLKLARSHLMRHTIGKVDMQISRQIFARLLDVRLDQLPTSVGSLSAQLRGYETIRSFLSTILVYVFVDAPFGLFFIAMVAIIGSPIAALVPLIFLIFAIGFGFVMQGRIDEIANKHADSANLKTGLLVEAIEGAETIKSGGGSWNLLSKWIDTSETASEQELNLRSVSEKISFFSNFFQQMSSVGLVAVGAYLAAEGQMTMGSLIACTILSGRALSPIVQLPGLIVQSAHAKAALLRLEKIFALEVDNHQVERPLIPEKLSGDYRLEGVTFSYPGSPKALQADSLIIQAGEKIGVVGPVGAGKSTLLRLLSGMYQVSSGRVLLDGLDIHNISRHFLAENIGYMQQDHRLFSGTLRENLLIGTVDPGDEVIKSAAAKTGLLEAISHHPKGLDLMIPEGGRGLSGGQKQLVAITRLLISDPSIWLLDEPTASMDTTAENRCIAAIQTTIRPEHTMLFVTHKPNLLKMVNKIIVVSNHRVVMMGGREEVLSKLIPSNKP